MINTSELDAFLRLANANTYANDQVQQVHPLRPGSKDYHFVKGDLTFHDTYFGTTRFIGEEVVYQKGVAVWGMNYRGYTIDETMGEGLYDTILRPALMAGSGDTIPVRGPREFIQGEWKYTFSVEGTLINFIGIEEIARNNIAVCRLHCHGGFIQ